jgi:ribosomal protein L29
VEDTTSTEYQNYADYLKWQLFELSMSRNAGPVVVGPPQIRLDRHQVALAMSPNQGRVVVGPQTRLDRHQLALAMSPNQGRVVLEQQGRVKRSSAYVIDAVDQLALERTRRMADV